MLAQSGSIAAASSITISSLVLGARYKLILNMLQNTSTGFLTQQFNADSGANYKYGAVNINAAGFSGWASQSATSISLVASGNNINTATSWIAEILMCPTQGSNNSETIFANIAYNDGTNSRQSGAVVSGAYAGASAVASTLLTISAGTMTGNWYLYLLT